MYVASWSGGKDGCLACYKATQSGYEVTYLVNFISETYQRVRFHGSPKDLLKAQAEAEIAARETLDLTQEQFRLGAVSYLSLLNAERQYQQARISLVQAQAARFADTAALFQALGGGWWNRRPQDDITAPRNKE